MKELIKVKAQTACELLAHFELDTDIQIDDDLNVSQALSLLMKESLFFDAIKLLAHALPKREAVWWSCLATRQGQTDSTTEDNKQALLAAETWVKNPTEDNRQMAKKLANKTKQRTAASWAATAAFWSTGSLNPSDEPAIPVPKYLYAHAVSGCIALAASEVFPDDPTPFLKIFIARGIDLASGGTGQLAD